MAATNSRIIELAQIILSHTSSIDTTLSLRNLPKPTFDPNVDVTFPTDIAASRDIVLEATQELHDLLLAPMTLIQRKSSHNTMTSFKAISRYDIASCFAPPETITYAKLSQSCGLEEKSLKHLLRHAMTMRIFSEPEKGVVAHTAASKWMRDGDCRTYVGMQAEDVWPASVRLVDALSKWPSSEEPHETGWNIARNTTTPLFQSLAEDSVLAARLGATMSAILTKDPTFDPRYLHKSFDWEALGPGLVVDMGGSYGAISVSLASEYNSLRFVSQDLKGTIDSAPGNAVPEELKSRVKLMAHDFFTPQPVMGASVYLYRSVLHNWSDKYAAKILQALVPALKTGSRVLVQDGCLPDPGEVLNAKAMDLRRMDLMMKALCNTWERDADEWRELFAKADARFEFMGITQPEGSGMSLIEVKWTG